MKLSNAVLSGLLSMVFAAPSAMAADADSQQYMEKRMEQTRENKEMYMEKRKNRFEKHEEKKAQNKDMYQNRLKEKQDRGFRMNSGSGGKH